MWFWIELFILVMTVICRSWKFAYCLVERLKQAWKANLSTKHFMGKKNDNTRGFPTYNRIRNRLRMFPAEKFYLIFSDLIFRASLDANVLTSASKIPLFSLYFNEVTENVVWHANNCDMLSCFETLLIVSNFNTNNDTQLWYRSKGCKCCNLKKMRLFDHVTNLQYREQSK